MKFLRLWKRSPFSDASDRVFLARLGAVQSTMSDINAHF